jgi:hypothetical protein
MHSRVVIIFGQTTPNGLGVSYHRLRPPDTGRVFAQKVGGFYWREACSIPLSVRDGPAHAVFKLTNENKISDMELVPLKRR